MTWSILNVNGKKWGTKKEHIIIITTTTNSKIFFFLHKIYTEKKLKKIGQKEKERGCRLGWTWKMMMLNAGWCWWYFVRQLKEKSKSGSVFFVVETANIHFTIPTASYNILGDKEEDSTSTTTTIWRWWWRGDDDTFAFPRKNIFVCVFVCALCVLSSSVGRLLGEDERGMNEEAKKRKPKVFPSRLSHTLYVHTIFYGSLDFSFFSPTKKKYTYVYCVRWWWWWL